VKSGILKKKRNSHSDFVGDWTESTFQVFMQILENECGSYLLRTDRTYCGHSGENAVRNLVCCSQSSEVALVN